MLTGVVVSASNFLYVVIILCFFIFVFDLKNKNPANEVRRVSYLGLQLISVQITNFSGSQNLMGATSYWYGGF